MKTKLTAALAAFLSFEASGFAHRLDEYLQAAIISVSKNRIQVSMRLVPGVAVASTVLAEIDTNRDGILSETERQSYAQRVLRDLTLSVDGHRFNPRLVSVVFPEPDAIRQGLGEIQIEFSGDLPRGEVNRKLIFENHHENRISAYLVNCLVPRDPDIHISAQNRNVLQSFYQLDYVQEAPSVGSAASGDSLVRSSASSFVFWFHGFAGMFHLGMQHIAEGTDHLLFLLTLLLPAPLIVRGSRWTGFASVHQSLLRILKVVTAFTIGHSLTLALAGWGLIHVPTRPIEVLIAVSILYPPSMRFAPCSRAAKRALPVSSASFMVWRLPQPWEI